jgi:hypothetical protein
MNVNFVLGPEQASSLFLMCGVCCVSFDINFIGMVSIVYYIKEAVYE